MMRPRAMHQRSPVKMARGYPSGNSAWVSGWCRGEDAFVVAGGSSLRRFDFERLRGRKVVAVNRSIYHVPADVLVFVDSETANEFRQKIPGFPDECGFRTICGHNASMRPAGNVAVVRVTNYGVHNIHHTGPFLHRMSSTVFGICAAIAGGASRVFLLGVDLDGRPHFYPDHPYAGVPPQKQQMQFTRQATAFEAIPKHYHDMIFNLSRESKLTTFRKMSIREALCSPS